MDDLEGLAGEHDDAVELDETSVLDPTEGQERVDPRELVEEEPEETPPVSAQPPLQTPAEHGLYRRYRAAERRAEAAEGRYGDLAGELKELRELVTKFTTSDEERRRAEAEAAAVPGDDDPLGKLTYGLTGAVKPLLQPVAEKLETLEKRFSERDEAENQRQQQERLRWAQSVVAEAKHRAATEMQSAPAQLRAHVEHNLQANYNALMEQHGDHDLALNAIEDSMAKVYLQSRQAGMSLTDYLAVCFGLDPAALAETDQQGVHQPVADARARRRAKAPTTVSRGEAAPTGGSSSPIYALAKARLEGKFDSQEAVYAEVARVAKALKTDPLSVQDAVARQLRTLRSGSRAAA